jgi:hypothetical protein
MSAWADLYCYVLGCAWTAVCQLHVIDSVHREFVRRYEPGHSIQLRRRKEHRGEFCEIYCPAQIGA